MILGRPSNLILGAFVALVNVVVLVLASQGLKVDGETVAAINIAAGAIIAVIANQPPTLNEGTQVTVITPAGQPNRTTTV